jgi:hypothetical protein
MMSSSPGKSAKRVFAPLVPAIHVFRDVERQDVDARHKAGHNEEERLAIGSKSPSRGELDEWRH